MQPAPPNLSAPFASHPTFKDVIPASFPPSKNPSFPHREWLILTGKHGFLPRWPESSEEDPAHLAGDLSHFLQTSSLVVRVATSDL